MENKNFEKKEFTDSDSFTRGQEHGYNTCLDRTNAKGIYEALQKLVHLHLCEQEGISSGQPTMREWLDTIDFASEQLKKAEDN